MESGLKYKTQSSSFTRNFQKLRNQPVTQVSSALILTIFTVIFFAAFAIRPTLSTITQLIKKIDDQREVSEKLDKKATALATAQSEYLLVEDRLPMIGSAIPELSNLDLLLKQIEGVASVLGVPIESIRVDEVYFPEHLSKSADDLVSLPITINVSSEYQNLREFLSLATSMQRVLSAESVSLSLSESGGEESEIRMNLQMKAYYLPLEDTSDAADN
ncbi:type 4a pilus biogenesis protein PilO [Patescibacteria group bacterium]